MMRIIFNVEIICEWISLVWFLIQVLIVALWLMVEIRILPTHKMVFVWVLEHKVGIGAGVLRWGRW